MSEKIACVILNYNDCKNTIELVKSIEGYEIFNHIIVVDNCSTDDSLQMFETIKSEKVTVCSSGKNGGYGYGNNFGIRLAKEKYNCKYAIIANPDVRFSENSIYAVVECFERMPRCVVCSTVQMTADNKVFSASAWEIPSALRYTFSALWPVNKFINVKNTTITKKYTKVDCIAGSFIGVRINEFFSCGGFDENIFLYCEETIFGIRARNAGLEEYVIKDSFYHHFHATGSTSINIPSNIKKQKMLLNNRMYVIKEYMNSDKLTVLIAKICFSVAIVQEYLKNIIRKLFKN